MSRFLCRIASTLSLLVLLAIPLQTQSSVRNSHSTERRTQDFGLEELAAGKGGKPSNKHSETPSITPSWQPTLVPTVSPPTDAPTTLAPVPVPTTSPTLAPQRKPSPSPSSSPVVSTTEPPVIRPTFQQPPTREDVPVTAPEGGAGLIRVQSILSASLDPLGYDFVANTSDVASYQYKALLRTSEQENIALPARVIQYYCLFCLFYATNGYMGESTDLEDAYSRQEDVEWTWKNTSGWESNMHDPCDFFGVACDAFEQIQSIQLQRNGLTNMFPYEVLFLSAGGSFHIEGVGNLRHLEIFENQELQSGQDFLTFVQSMVGLQTLRYGYTALGKEKPIPKLPNTLQEFDCSYSEHDGVSEESFLGLNVLVLAVLDGNDVRSMPLSLVSLPNLKFLYLRDAALNGNLAYMERMTSIVEHAVDRNPGLTGSLPSSIGGSLKELRSFSASDCSLTGTFPAELSNSMVQLFLHGNKLVGTVPLSWSMSSGLRVLTLEDNVGLTGEIPIELCLNRFEGDLDSLSVDCDIPVECSNFFPECCTCCGRTECGS